MGPYLFNSFLQNSCYCCSEPLFGSLISVGDTFQGDSVLWVLVGGGCLQDQVAEGSVSVGVTASSASVSQLPGAWLIGKMKWREAERLGGGLVSASHGSFRGGPAWA